MDVFTKKWSPLEIQECDIQQGNKCGVRCTCLWSMINGHIIPILSKMVMNDHSVIPKANTYEFLTKKWSPLEI
jgi:hypothetical protein